MWQVQPLDTLFKSKGVEKKAVFTAHTVKMSVKLLICDQKKENNVPVNS